MGPPTYITSVSPRLCSCVPLQNLLLSTKNRLDGTIKIIDFGCAVVSDDYLDNDDDDETTTPPVPKPPKEKRAIKKASSTGTTAYWPPERFLGGNGTEATSAMDMWSVGVILYVRWKRSHLSLNDFALAPSRLPISLF